MNSSTAAERIMLLRSFDRSLNSFIKYNLKSSKKVFGLVFLLCTTVLSGLIVLMHFLGRLPKFTIYDSLYIPVTGVVLATFGWLLVLGYGYFFWIKIANFYRKIQENPGCELLDLQIRYEGGYSFKHTLVFPNLALRTKDHEYKLEWSEYVKYSGQYSSLQLEGYLLQRQDDGSYSAIRHFDGKNIGKIARYDVADLINPDALLC